MPYAPRTRSRRPLKLGRVEEELFARFWETRTLGYAGPRPDHLEIARRLREALLADGRESATVFRTDRGVRIVWADAAGVHSKGPRDPHPMHLEIAG